MIASYCSWCGSPGAMEGCEDCAAILSDIRAAIADVPDRVACVMLEVVADERNDPRSASQRRRPFGYFDANTTDATAIRFSLLEPKGNPLAVLPTKERT